LIRHSSDKKINTFAFNAINKKNQIKTQDHPTVNAVKERGRKEKEDNVKEYVKELLERIQHKGKTIGK